MINVKYAFAIVDPGMVNATDGWCKRHRAGRQYRFIELDFLCCTIFLLDNCSARAEQAALAKLCFQCWQLLRILQSTFSAAFKNRSLSLQHLGFCLII